MTTYEGKDKILDGWNAARIRDTLDERLKKLSDLDPYQDINPILMLFEEECNITKFLNIQMIKMTTISLNQKDVFPMFLILM